MRTTLIGAAAALLLAVPAWAAKPASGAWSSGYQMGTFWAGVKSANGDGLSFSCSEGVPGNPYIRKGLSVRVELAAVAEEGFERGRTVDVSIGPRGSAVTVPMIAEGGAAMALADLATFRADASKILAAIKRSKSVTVAFGAHATSFGMSGASKALEGVAECAASTR